MLSVILLTLNTLRNLEGLHFRYLCHLHVERDVETLTMYVPALEIENCKGSFLFPNFKTNA